MNNYRIASLLSKISCSADEEEHISSCLFALRENEETQLAFFNYCSTWKLAPWAYTQLKRKQLLNCFSEQVQSLFYTAHEKTKQENEKRSREALRFLDAFQKNNIDVIILKGNLFAQTVYTDAGYKKMNDFDILIHSEDWDKVQDIYFSLGYIPLGFGWSGEKQKAAKFSHVGMSFISPDFSCIVGSQWGLKSPTSPYQVDIANAWKTATVFDFYGVPVKRLSPEYNLLHLILHMGIYKCGIRDCMDVYNLLLSDPLDESLFLKLIEDKDTRDKAFFTLTLCNVCSGTPDDLIKKIKPSKSSFLLNRLSKRLLQQERTGDFQNSYTDYFQDIEKLVIYFNLFPEFHKKAVFYSRILRSIYFPKRETALKLSDRADSKSSADIFISRLKAPYYVFSLIAQEIGWKFTFLLFIKLFFDLLISLKNYLFKKDSYFDYLRKSGVDPEAILKAVKNIQ